MMSDGLRQRRNRANESNRNSLLSPTKQRSKKSSQSQAQDAKSITKSLQRTKSMMKTELERVAHVSEAIDADGKTLQSTKEEHYGMKGTVKGAKGSLTMLQIQEKKESIVFWSAVSFFYMAVLYVLWTRIRIPFLLW